MAPYLSVIIILLTEFLTDLYSVRGFGINLKETTLEIRNIFIT